MSEPRRRILSAFASELLARAHAQLGGAAFGRLGQEMLVAALRQLHPGLHANPGAGTPDVSASTGGSDWAWELKTTCGGEVQLGERDLRGLATAAGADPRPRLVVLDAAFPASLWVLEGTGLREGPLRPAAHAGRQRHDEADALAERVETILRCCDVELLARDERGAKELVRSCLERREGATGQLDVARAAP